MGQYDIEIVETTDYYQIIIWTWRLDNNNKDVLILMLWVDR
ncbi:MAG: hypothetical protein ACLRNZ_02905 [Blautia massiliensis (ex Durand et al. 2017)]